MKSIKKLPENKFFPFIVIAVLAVIFFYPLTIPGNILYSPTSDLMELSLMWSNNYHENFFPLWLNNVFFGYPIIGNFAAGYYYPLNLLFVLFEPAYFYSYFILFEIFLAGSFMYLFLRKLNLDNYSSLLGAMAFMFSGKMVAHLFAGHVSVINTLIWIPLSFLALELLIEKKNLKFALLFGVIIGVQILAGFFQLFFYNLFFLFLYFVFRLYSQRKTLNKNKLTKVIAFTVIALIIGLAIGSIQLLPSMQLGEQSSRFAGEGFTVVSASQLSLNYPNLIQVILPNFFGSPVDNSFVWSGSYYWTITFYAGILILLLALTSLLFKRNFHKNFFAFTAVFSILFSLGINFFLFPVLFYLIPGFDLFRIPPRMLFFFVFSLAVLAAFGANVLFSKKTAQETVRLKKFSLIISVLSVLSFVVLLVTVFFRDFIISFGEKFAEQAYNASMPNFQPLTFWLAKVPLVYSHLLQDVLILFLTLTVFCLILMSVLKGKLIVKGVSLKKVLFAAVFLELIVFSLPFIQSKPVAEIYASDKVIEFLQADESIFRVYDNCRSLESSGCYSQAKYSFYGIELANGYDPAHLQNADLVLSNVSQEKSKEFNDLQVSELGFMNVKYVLSREPISNSNLELVLDSEVKVYENKLVKPRAFIVLFESEKIVPANITHYSANKIELKVEITEPGSLVLTDSYFPGWKATVNGTEVEVEQVFTAFRGITLQPGSYEIVFLFG
ncbi:MAG: YfhO family protein [archaeon]